MMSVRAQDGRNGILIDQGLSGKELVVTGTILITLYNRGLDRKGDLGVGDDRREQECMGMSAGLTQDPCDPEQKVRIALSEIPEITTVPDQATGMSAGTGKQG